VPFQSLQLHPDLLRGIQELGFVQPTPIQTAAIPPALQGRDLLACAVTGSGKTAAFLLPILHRLISKPRRITRALILAPTRELAAQIHADLEEIGAHTAVTGGVIVGGVNARPQEHLLRSGVDVIVATPGRLLDHMSLPYASFGGLEILVLDEADRMLDMGFLPDVKRILARLPARRQTLFFSATMPEPIVALSRDILRDPVRVELQRRAAPAVGITQAVYPVPQELKASLLLMLLRSGTVREALVFTRTKHRANRLAEQLVRGGIPTERIHGNRSQAQRTAALEGFKNGRYRVLVATDIAARGIDVQELGHVVNFDVPAVPDDYIHRVGRTGRAEATGEAFTFVAPDEEADLRGIERAVNRRLPRVTLPDFDYTRRATEKLEVPLNERLAAHRARKPARGGSAKGPGVRPGGGRSGPPRRRSR
jgi:ATP-dependent RNA helicase RhlE